ALADAAAAVGLLLVPVLALGGRGNGLAVGDARWPRVHLDTVALADAFQHHPQVQLAEAADHRLVELGIVLDLEARVLLGQLVQGGGQLLFLAAGGGLDGQAEHGPGELQRLEADVVLVVAVVQHRVEVDLLDLGHRGDVARYGPIDLDVVLALQLEQVADPEGLAAIIDEQLAVLAHRALEDTEDAELADEGIVDDLEDVGDDVRVR